MEITLSSIIVAKKAPISKKNPPKGASISLFPSVRSRDSTEVTKRAHPRRYTKTWSPPSASSPTEETPCRSSSPSRPRTSAFAKSSAAAHRGESFCRTCARDTSFPSSKNALLYHSPSQAFSLILCVNATRYSKYKFALSSSYFSSN